MKYYIYTLSDPRTNIVRYIGKTKDMEDILRKVIWKNMRKIHIEGGEVGVDWSGRKHQKSSIQKISDNNRRREVTQFDLNGNIIGEFRSLSEAVRKTGCHIFLISNCCEKKKYYTVNNTTFRYKGDEFDYYPYNKNKQVNSKSVIKYSLDGEVIQKFDSQRDAARDVKTSHSNIKRCCELKCKTNTHGVKTDKPIVVKGFTYRYGDDKF